MNPRLPFLSTALLTGLLLAAAPAEARFGKKSSSDSSQGDSKGSNSSTSQGTHDASPVGASRPAPPPPAPSRPSHEAVPVDRPYSSSGYHGAYAPPPTYYAPSRPGYYSRPSASVSASGEGDSPLHKNFLFGFDMQAMPGGASAGLHLGVEGERWGGMLRASGMSLRADDGSGEQDSISLFETHLSYALVARERGRLRLEGGLSVAKAANVTFVGPMMGTSAEYYMLDTLALEGRVQGTLIPYRQLDASGGLAWYVLSNIVALRAGARLLVLDDAGVVDGVVHRDVLPGPYLSIGLVI